MRANGVLLPISSLPSPYGIGCFDQKAYDFIDSLNAAGQRYWQILPLGPTSYGDSPYQSFSTFAGNPYFISLVELVNQGLLTYDECNAANFGSNPDYVDYERLYYERYPLLRRAYERSHIEQNPEFSQFVQDNAQWLEDYALFMAIKDDKGGVQFNEWEDEIKNREPEALEIYRERLSDSVIFYQYLQYEFYSEWNRLKDYANEKNIQIIGDIPIYVAADSADSWANRDLFQFDENMEPVAVAGCPPDGFSPTGQLWGNPLYNWEYHEKTGYEWWVSRISHCAKLYDIVRIDHFRGFDAYYSIPYGEPTAENGHWEKGPGIKLFNVLRKKLGGLNIIAEDLGFLTDSVREMLAETGFPGMKVLQFAFNPSEESDYLPHNYGRNCVVYTGTHDNETTRAWIENMPDWDRQVALKYINRQGEQDSYRLTWDMICLAMGSVADLCILPLADILCLRDEARINTPSTLGNNWKWRMWDGAFGRELQEKMYGLTKIYSRL